MRQAARVDDQPGRRAARALHPVDQGALAVGLAEIDRQVERRRVRRAGRLDVGERLGAIDLRLARAEQVEIGAVQDEHGGGHRLVREPSYAPG